MHEYVSQLLWSVVSTAGFAAFVAWRRKRRHRQPSTFGGPAFARALREAGEGRLEPLHKLIRDTESADMKVAFLQGLTQEPLKNVQRWASAHTEDPAALLMLGEAFIVDAWRRRAAGRGKSAEANEAAYMSMYDALTQALSAFEAAAALDEKDATPWIRMCDLAAGLELPRAQAEGYFQQARARDPESFRAHVAMTSYLTEKWHGSHDEMFEFVHKVSAEAPENSDLHMLIAYAAWERHHYYLNSDELGWDSFKIRNAPELREQVLVAYRRSLGSDTYVNRPGSVVARNYAAFWFFVAEMKLELTRELIELEFDYAMTPWGFLKAPTKAFADARIMAKL